MTANNAYPITTTQPLTPNSIQHKPLLWALENASSEYDACKKAMYYEYVGLLEETTVASITNYLRHHGAVQPSPVALPNYWSISNQYMVLSINVMPSGRVVISLNLLPERRKAPQQTQQQSAQQAPQQAQQKKKLSRRVYPVSSSFRRSQCLNLLSERREALQNSEAEQSHEMRERMTDKVHVELLDMLEKWWALHTAQVELYRMGDEAPGNGVYELNDYYHSKKAWLIQSLTPEAYTLLSKHRCVNIDGVSFSFRPGTADWPIDQLCGRPALSL